MKRNKVSAEEILTLLVENGMVSSRHFGSDDYKSLSFEKDFAFNEEQKQMAITLIQQEFGIMHTTCVETLRDVKCALK